MTIFSIINKISKAINHRYYLLQSLVNVVRLKAQGAIILKDSFIPGHLYVDIREHAKVSIGERFTFSNGMGLNPLARNVRGMIFCDYGAELIIGNNVGMSSVALWARKKIIIGDNVNIGANTILIDTDAHSLDYLKRRDKTIVFGYRTVDQEMAKSADIIIEDDVLIGVNCIVLKGVRIGARSVIGAGSVVVTDIPADSIAVGNPCKVKMSIM